VGANEGDNESKFQSFSHVRLAIVVEETGCVVQANPAEPAQAPRWVGKAQKL